MRKNIHKKIRNTPDTKTRRTKPQGRKKSPPDQKSNQKFVVLWRRWILFNVYLYVHLRHNEQKLFDKERHKQSGYKTHN